MSKKWSRFRINISDSLVILLFCIVHKSCINTKFQNLMSKASHLNFSLNTHFFCDEHIFCKSLLLCASFSVLSRRQSFLAHLITQCVTSFWFYLTSTFSFLNNIFLQSLVLLASVQSLSHRQCLLLHPTHHHKRHLFICQRLPPQQHNKTTPLMVSQCLHPAAPLLPASSLASRSLLAACRPMLVLPIAAQHLVSHPALISVPPTVGTK